MKNSVSVIIPAYNAASYIAETIDSVIHQTLPAKEILVIDDGSTDKTAEIVKTFQGAVELIQLENSGVSHARNVGMDRATSDWVAFLDSDDTWHEKKLEVCLDAAQETPACSFVFSDFRTFGSETGDQPLAEHFKNWRASDQLLVPLVCVLPSASVVRKSVTARFPEWAGNDCEDSIFFNDLVDEGPVIHIPEILVNYRRHDTSAQKQSGSRERGCENLLKRYSNEAHDRKRMANTLLTLVQQKRQMRQWDYHNYLCQFLIKHWPEQRLQTLSLRLMMLAKPVYDLKDQLEFLSKRHSS